MLVTPLGEKLPPTATVSLVARKSQSKVPPPLKVKLLLMVKVAAVPLPPGLRMLPLPAATAPVTVPFPASVLPLPKVNPDAETSNVAPLATVTELPSELPAPKMNAPLLTDKVPVKFAPEPSCNRVPALVSAKVPVPASGSLLVRNKPDLISKIPPAESMVIPALEWSKAKLPCGLKMPLFNSNCATLKLAGLPPIAASLVTMMVPRSLPQPVLNMAISGPVKLVLLAL